MIGLSFNITKDSVYEEVQKLTTYAGKKIDDLAPAAQQGEQTTPFDRIRATSYDTEMLDRFWNEAVSRASERMKNVSSSLINSTTALSVILNLSASWDNKLQPVIVDSLTAYLINYITSRWFNLANKEEAEMYMAEANVMLQNVMRAAFFRKKPTRVTPS